MLRSYVPPKPSSGVSNIGEKSLNSFLEGAVVVLSVGTKGSSDWVLRAATIANHNAVWRICTDGSAGATVLKCRGGAGVRIRTAGRAGACITRKDCGVAGFAARDTAIAADGRRYRNATTAHTICTGSILCTWIAVDAGGAVVVNSGAG